MPQSQLFEFLQKINLNTEYENYVHDFYTSLKNEIDTQETSFNAFSKLERDSWYTWQKN